MRQFKETPMDTVYQMILAVATRMNPCGTCCCFKHLALVTLQRRIGELDLARLPVALIIPLVASIAVAFPTTVIESAALRGWLSAALHIVVMFLMLWKYAGFPASRSVSYTGAGVIISTVLQSIWFFWLVDF